MICRVWRGWTTKQNAGAYESVVRKIVIPGIEARRVSGFLHIDLMRRDLEEEFEFSTLMWFDSLDAVRAFIGEDYEVSHVPTKRGPCWRASTIEPRISKCWTGARRSNAAKRGCWTPNLEGEG